MTSHHPLRRRWSNALSIALFITGAAAQEVRIRPAEYASMPGMVDSNSPAFWRDGVLHLYDSTGDGPLLSRGTGQTQLIAPHPVSPSLRENWADLDRIRVDGPPVARYPRSTATGIWASVPGGWLFRGPAPLSH